MDKKRQRQLAEAFRSLHAGPALLLLVNVWDALSARLVEEAGFNAAATTSGGVNWALGYADGECAPWHEVCAATARIARVLRVPLSADIEEGYGSNPSEVARAVADIVGAGAAGINLEDGTKSAVKPLREIGEMASRIAAARNAARAAEIPIVINARIDIYLKQIGDPDSRFAETVRRAEAYVAAGADCIFAFGVTDAETIGRLAKAIPAPLNIVGRAGTPHLDELAKLGVRRVSTASGLTMMAIEEVQRVARNLHDGAGFEIFSSKIKRPEIQKLFDGGGS